MDSKLEIRAQNAPWMRAVQLLIRRGDWIGVEVKMERAATGFEKPATLSIEIEAAQTLMDDLWNCGLRPTEGSGSAGALSATQHHLNDMRKLVFKS